MADIPTSKNFLPELEFASYEIDKVKQFNDYVIQAKKIITERLPTFGELNAVVEVTLGGPYDGKIQTVSPIYIDARPESPPKVLDNAPEGTKVDYSFSIRPELLIEIYEGTMTYRTATFQDMKAYPQSWVMPGPGLRLLQLLSCGVPYLLDPKKMWDPKELPKPTRDVEEIKRNIKEWGFGFVKDALSPQQLKIINKAVLEQAAGEIKAGVADWEGPNQRVWNLVNKGDEFLDLLNDPLIDEFVPWYLADNAILSSFSCNIAKPGSKPQFLHRDQGSQGPPVWHFPYGMQISYYLVENTEEIGATRVIPKTHLGNHAPVNDFSIDGTVPASAPAGTALIFDSRLWHGTGANVSENGIRPVIFAYFTRGHLRSHEAFAVHLHKDVEQKLSPRQKALLGFRTHGALGNTKGPLKPSKTFTSRDEETPGRLREKSPHLTYENGHA